MVSNFVPAARRVVLHRDEVNRVYVADVAGHRWEVQRRPGYWFAFWASVSEDVEAFREAAEAAFVAPTLREVRDRLSVLGEVHRIERILAEEFGA